MKFILFWNVCFDDGAEGFVEICKDLEELFVAFVDAMDEFRHFVLFEVFSKGSETVIHELGDLDGVVVFVVAMNGETDWAN